jgi:hypothetical protein
MNEFNESEKWIAITSIMKTSETMKKLPKEIVDYLFINLRREFAPHIKDDEVKKIESLINNLAKEVQKTSFDTATKMLGKGDQKEAIKQLEHIVGKEKADVVTKLFGKRN